MGRDFIVVIVRRSLRIQEQPIIVVGLDVCDGQILLTASGQSPSKLFGIPAIVRHGEFGRIGDLGCARIDKLFFLSYAQVRYGLSSSNTVESSIA